MRGFSGTAPSGPLYYWRAPTDGPYKNSLKSGLLNGLAEHNTALPRDFFASLPPADQVGQPGRRRPRASSPIPAKANPPPKGSGTTVVMETLSKLALAVAVSPDPRRTTS